MDLRPMTYQEFLQSKISPSHDLGFEVRKKEIHWLLTDPLKGKPHQGDIVQWAVKKGRAAIFAAFGLGKTVIQLEIARLNCKKI